MKRTILTALSVGSVALGAAPVSAQDMPQMAAMEAVEITGQVVDMSCKQVFNLSGETHRMCAEVCADQGIPLGILTADGTLYLPVSAAMPGTGANQQLRAHAEQTVTVRGKRLTRSAINSIVIESVSTR